MRPILCLCLVAAVSPTVAGTEDAAHRADRLRTQQLNRQAALAPAGRDKANAAGRDAYAAAQARYERERAVWARRVEACRMGDRSACG